MRTTLCASIINSRASYEFSSSAIHLRQSSSQTLRRESENEDNDNSSIVDQKQAVHSLRQDNSGQSHRLRR